jgi:UDP-3-O-[3-hydroxymyristoyl] glucosamine N-acyltransferase
MRLKEIAERINGILHGDADIEINTIVGLDEAKEGSLTFIKHKKLIPKLKETKASAVIVGEHIKELPIPQIVVENPLYGFAKALEVFYTKPYIPKGILKGAYISESARIGKEVTIYPNTFISNNVVIGDRTIIYPGVFIGDDSKIGNDCIIYPNVTIRENVSIGSRVIIHAGSVIGSDGFGYVTHEGRHHKIPQVGGVVIEDDVEIGACVTIDRATTGNTQIGEGTKIDNLVQIAHNVKIGKHCIVVAQVGIAGSSTVGNYVVLAGQVGISDHITIEDGCIVAAKAGVMRNLEKGAYSGAPAIPHMKWLRIQAIIEKLPDLYKTVKELEARLNKIDIPESGGKNG